MKALVRLSDLVKALEIRRRLYSIVRMVFSLSY